MSVCLPRAFRLKSVSFAVFAAVMAASLAAHGQTDVTTSAAPDRAGPTPRLEDDESLIVRDIRVEGLQRTDPGTVFSYLGVKVGDRFNRERASEAIRALYATGFFRDVRIEAQDGVLIVSVVERPTVASLDITGAREFDLDTLKKALRDAGLAEGRIFDRTILDKAEQEIKRQYLARGRYDVEVTTTLTPLERNRTAVSIAVREGEVARIESINIVGATAFSERTLLNQLQLSTGGWFSWYTKDNQYSKQKLQGDLETLRNFYLNRGYLEFNIDSTQVSLSPDRQRVYITINITEGEQFTVSGVDVSGEMLLSEAEVRSLIPIRPGQIFSRTALADGTKAIADRLGREGYAFASVNPVPTIDREKRTVAFNFVIDPGRRVYVRRINISGNVQTRDEVIRRELRQLEAAWYDQAKIQRSKVRLDRLGFFSEVTIDNQPVPGAPDQVDLDITVTERNTGTLNAGAGYSSAEKLVLTASLSQNNVLGTGNALSIQVNTSRASKTAVFSYSNPYWTKDGVGRGIDLYRRTYDSSTTGIEAYSLATTGAGLRFTVPISETDSVSLGLLAESQGLTLTEGVSPRRYFDYVKNFGRVTNAYKVSGGWQRDTRDSIIFPTRGWLQAIGLEGTLPVTNVKFYKINYQGQLFVPLVNDFVYGINVDLGFAAGYGARPLPFFQNYYGGGVGSVRGYETNSLGPREPVTSTVTGPDGQPVSTTTFTGGALGGRRKIVVNNELLFPFPGTRNDKSVRGSIFFDAGQIYDRGEQKDNERFRFSVGLAIAWQSPIGALKFSYAFPLATKPTDKLQRFQFQVGTLF
ncbi:MAG: outer membrane protein assembly factor BamA [Casimicrobiaceae bacterium]|nr:outer membrane protein assembly factor BamA [Casimicrobiaceae bacterium]